jgi:hypothetical protein
LVAMSRWIEALKEASWRTRFFYLNWAFYVLAILASTFYCYARLEFVRSGPPRTHVQESK